MVLMDLNPRECEAAELHFLVGVIPRKHTQINCLQLELAALTFLWEMKISGGAEQLILDSVFN